MNTVPSVPEALDRDFRSWHNLILRWKEEVNGQIRAVVIRPVSGTLALARIELRPVIVVEEFESGDLDGEATTLAEIPLESLHSVDVDYLETHPGAVDLDDTSEGLEETIPVARWVRDPDKGLVRFSEA